MRLSAFALSFTVLGALSLVGCNNSDSGTSTAPPPGVGSEMAGGMPAPAGMAPQSGASPSLTAGGKGAGKTTSFDKAPESMKKLWGGDSSSMPPMGGAGAAAVAGSKPSPVHDGIVALASRKDPFESLFKEVVQITPAWNYAISRRTEAPFVPTVVKPGPIDPEDLPPLPPIPRRVAGVFYNGGITAIIESGNPPDSVITIVQPGAEVDSGVPGVPQLIVESIAMDSLILRARDGRSVEVKLSGLAPSVRDALRQQFAPTGGGNNAGPGMGGMGSGMPGGMGRPGGGGGGGGKSGGIGGGGGA